MPGKFTVGDFTLRTGFINKVVKQEEGYINNSLLNQKYSKLIDFTKDDEKPDRVASFAAKPFRCNYITMQNILIFSNNFLKNYFDEEDILNYLIYHDGLLNAMYMFVSVSPPVNLFYRFGFHLTAVQLVNSVNFSHATQFKSL